mmetsp:Transcript_9756/g.22542  ORF Transcript_9756/g.22542 Transcript_9756/m.22542 type:complete len:494 (+) Transcript_9756:311-1792(+)
MMANPERLKRSERGPPRMNRALLVTGLVALQAAALIDADRGGGGSGGGGRGDRFGFGDGDGRQFGLFEIKPRTFCSTEDGWLGLDMPEEIEEPQEPEDDYGEGEVDDGEGEDNGDGKDNVDGDGDDDDDDNDNDNDDDDDDDVDEDDDDDDVGEIGAGRLARPALAKRGSPSAAANAESSPMDSSEGEEELDGESYESDPDSEDDAGSSDPEENVAEQLRETLRDMPMAELAKLKQRGVNGVPLHKALNLPGPEYLSAWLEGTYDPDKLPQRKPAAATAVDEADEEAPKKGGKKRKGAPMEMSSKKQVSRFRHVVPTKNRKIRDPRFDTMSGTLDEEVFDKRYAFLHEERDLEIDELRKAIRKDKDLRSKTAKQRQHQKVRIMDEDERRAAISRLTQLKQSKMLGERKRVQRDVQRTARKAEMEKVSKGKNPFYLKRSELKKLELAKRFETLEKAGKLEQYMEKRRKKNATKERKLLPGFARRERTNGPPTGF